jgi:hypothetical protein
MSTAINLLNVIRICCCTSYRSSRYNDSVVELFFSARVLKFSAMYGLPRRFLLVAVCTKAQFHLPLHAGRPRKIRQRKLNTRAV